MEGIADRIRKVLADEGWSQRELARRVGFTTPSQLNGILRNLDRDEGAVERSTLMRIARGAEVSERWLLLGEGSACREGVDRALGPPEVASSPTTHPIGHEQALIEARQREPQIREYAWEAVEQSLPYIVRGIVTARDLIRLARVAEELADPARVEAALERQTARVQELEAQVSRTTGSTTGCASTRGRQRSATGARRQSDIP